ncbi:MAG: hypothetical protein ACREL5_02055 [Gemmatimonadales bacterium]
MTMRRGAEQRVRLRWGVLCAVAMTAVAGLVWGRDSMAGAAIFGVVAIVLQMIAASLMGRTGVPAALDHLKVYVIGVLLRFGGVVLLGVAIVLDRGFFRPWPSAIGYVGTILPLLYLETRLAR